MSPYDLPEGNVQISFSGGRTSAYMLHEMLLANSGLPDRARVVFSNTGREFPETLDFVHECGERWGVPIYWIEYEKGKPGYRLVERETAAEGGKPFEDLVWSRSFLPNQRFRFCTQELKVRPAAKYLRGLGWEKWTSALGIRFDEQRRVRTEPLKERWQRWYPLNDAQVTKEDVLAFWGRQSFDLRLPSVDGKTPLGNCDGCFLKSEANLANLARSYPERHKWWRDMEALASMLSSNPSGATFSKRYSRKDIDDDIARMGEKLFDTEGLLCQADGGECTDDVDDDDVFS
jgi:3'-phosphoadenosine 5'-phosphosulfate sulfotransferase (PAPS reductase)/FAD synthetase